MNMEEWVVGVLSAYGLAGVVIAGLVLTVRKLYNRNLDLTDTLIQIGNQSVASNAAMTASLDKLAMSLRYQKLSSE